MEHYVTLFDHVFLPQGLALHASLQRHAGPYTLWILCVDDAAHSALRALDLPNVRLLAADEVANERLRAVKGARTRAEYCWTLTPFAPGFVFDAEPSARRVTYLDADLWFTRSPKPLFADFEGSGKAVLISEHAYAPEYDQTTLTGRFCVQFMTFVRDRGEMVRSWWADRCIEWCYARLEDGKFGDQMYLNDWPERFADQVHVLRERQCMQGPWNSTRFPPGEARVFHFHGLRLMRDGYVLLTPDYHVPAPTLAMIYKPYLADLKVAVQRLNALGVVVGPQTLLRHRSVAIKGALRNLAHALLAFRMRRSVRL